VQHNASAAVDKNLLAMGRYSGELGNNKVKAAVKYKLEAMWLESGDQL